MSAGQLIIGDRIFPVTSSELMGYLATVDDRWCCRWHLDINAEERTFSRKDEEAADRWEPYAYAHHLRLGVRSWRDLEGIVVTGNDEQGDGLSVGRVETAFRLFVYEHAPIANNRIEFTNRNGDQFDLTWTGKAAVYSGDYWEGLPFRIESKVRFTRVAVVLNSIAANTPEPDIAAIFAGVMNPAHFRQLPTRKRAEPGGRWAWETDFVPG
jgi:hypothetical protein